MPRWFSRRTVTHSVDSAMSTDERAIKLETQRVAQDLAHRLKALGLEVDQLIDRMPPAPTLAASHHRRER